MVPIRGAPAHHHRRAPTEQQGPVPGLGGRQVSDGGRVSFVVGVFFFIIAGVAIRPGYFFKSRPVAVKIIAGKINKGCIIKIQGCGPQVNGKEREIGGA